MAYDPTALQRILDAAAPPDLALSFRSMFGGILAYIEGKPIASLSDVGLALKFAAADHAAFLALAGVVPLRYAPDQPASKSYLVVPDGMLEDHAMLRPWIARSAAAARAAALPSRKAKP
jgi:TfoX/Sxy family transcriptional regulator of competence genes